MAYAAKSAGETWVGHVEGGARLSGSLLTTVSQHDVTMQTHMTLSSVRENDGGGILDDTRGQLFGGLIKLDRQITRSERLLDWD